MGIPTHQVDVTTTPRLTAVDARPRTANLHAIMDWIDAAAQAHGAPVTLLVYPADHRFEVSVSSLELLHVWTVLLDTHTDPTWCEDDDLQALIGTATGRLMGWDVELRYLAQTGTDGGATERTA